MALPTLFVLTFVTFFLTTAARGDPAEAALRQGGQEPTAEAIAAYRVKLGLGDPLPVRYGRWLLGLTRRDLGTSFLSQRPVSEVIGERIEPTLRLGLTAFIVTTLVGVGLGEVRCVHTSFWYPSEPKVVILRCPSGRRSSGSSVLRRSPTDTATRIGHTPEERSVVQTSRTGIHPLLPI